MKIGICTDFYSKRGGIRSHIGCISKELESRGHEVTIVTGTSTGHNPESRIENTPAEGSENRVVAENFVELRNILKDRSFDIVHGHHAFAPLSLLSIFIANMQGKKTVLTNHSLSYGHDYGFLWSPLSYFLFPHRVLINRTNKLISVSEASAEFLNHFADGGEIEVVHNPVGEKFFRNYPPTSSFVNDDGGKILYAGRLSPEKSLHSLLFAMRKVFEELPESELLLVGDGYLKPVLEFLANSLGIEENVRFLGGVPHSEMPPVYEKADLVVLPSFKEAFPIALLEAMASGKPVVTSDVGGIREMIEDGYNGIIVKNRREGLSKGIIRVLKRPNLAKRLGLNARKSAEKYRPCKITDRIEKIYEKLL